MASAKQIAANQRNSKQSTGPRTEAGKRIARMNAFSHGLSGHTVLKTTEQDEVWAAYYHHMIPDLAPSSAIELDLAQRIIHDSWRLSRASAVEENIIALGMIDYGDEFNSGDSARDTALIEARVFQNGAKTFNLLSLYEQRLQRSIQKNLALLRAIQEDRKAAEKAAAQPAPTPKPLPQPVDAPAPSAPNGFVCSTPQSTAAPPPLEAENSPENLAA